MGSEERNYTIARGVSACDFSLKKALDMLIGRKGGTKSERVKRKGRERRNKVRSRRRQEELRWGWGRDSCRGSEDEG